MTTVRNRRLFIGLLVVLVILLDRLSKDWIVAHVRAGSGIVIIPHVFRLTHVLNTGAAFSLFEDSLSPLMVRNLLIGFSVVAVLIVGCLLWKSAEAVSTTSVALALILGGALGNLYDRLWLRHVVDFLEVYIVHYHWPDFNIADSCIVIGACLLLIEVFRPQEQK